LAQCASNGVVPGHAQELKHGMNELGADMNIINMAGGGDIDLAVQEGILEADAFIVFGSAKYGEDTGNAACTYYESKFAQSQRKKIILIRMIPFDEEFVFPQAKFMFGLNMLELPWMLGTSMPPDLPRLVVEAMAEGVTAATDAAASCEPEAAAAPGVDSALMAERARVREQEAQLQAQQAQAVAAQSEQKAALEAQAAQLKTQMEQQMAAQKATLEAQLKAQQDAASVALAQQMQRSRERVSGDSINKPSGV
jgi:hypothetical protein